MKSAEGAGRTVEEAIRDALRVLGAKRDDVDLMVLDEGNRGVLGLGSREARVRLTLLSAEGEPEEDEATPGPEAETGGDPLATARNVTSALIGAMGFRGAINVREDDGAVLVTITGANLAPLIGRHGQTLEALDLLVNMMVSRRMGRRVPVVVDAERYRERRREALTALAHRTADRVRRTGESVPLEPMSASERRVIHTVLADDEGVATHSEGEGADRHVVVGLRGEETAAGPESGVLEEDLDRSDDPEQPQD
ncbi:MAG TPA: RNA-binding cell elongation regulator Jag/EloR [Candidatus Acidoferrales bacterium]|nr:RNA-binding cell elongation regulator Jag/EloR [Candidatus Acidoferrales bacterium]